jgi:transposase
MFSLATTARIFVYTQAADIRKGVPGLSGIIREEFASDPTDGNLFVFINRRRNRMKILHFDDGGFWLYYRVLETGTFESLRNPDKSIAISMDPTELSMLLSGVSLAASGRRRKRYSKPTEQAA